MEKIKGDTKEKTISKSSLDKKKEFIKALKEAAGIWTKEATSSEYVSKIRNDWEERAKNPGETP